MVIARFKVGGREAVAKTWVPDVYSNPVIACPAENAVVAQIASQYVITVSTFDVIISRSAVYHVSVSMADKGVSCPNHRSKGHHHLHHRYNHHPFRRVTRQRQHRRKWSRCLILR